MRRLLRVLGRGDVLRDLHLYGGLALAGWGGWQLSPGLALVGLGLVLFLLGLFAGREPRGPAATFHASAIRGTDEDARRAFETLRRRDAA